MFVYRNVIGTSSMNAKPAKMRTKASGKEQYDMKEARMIFSLEQGYVVNCCSSMM